MTRRFDVGPVLVAVAAIALLVSLFLDWYGSATAWDAFELVDLLLAALGVGAIVLAVALLVPDVPGLDARWLPGVALAAAVVVAAAILDPPPAVGDASPGTGAWLAFGAALVMVVGTVLSLSRVSLAVSLEGRDEREHVAVVDHRQDTTETTPLAPPAERARQARD
jgi:hypothetical protein